MFLAEARIAARLNHPNIVQTYEVGNEGDRYFIAMEYLEGQPLSAVYRRVGRKQIPLEIHLRILADILAGLEHAHELSDFRRARLDVVHRDVSPQNVFITYAGQVKLVDFGIAKVAGAASTTRKGMLKGKISYIAPEQCRCDAVDARADLFAVGVMLWEAIAGRRLVQKDDEKSVLARRMYGEDPPVRDAAPDAPAELTSICDRAMASDPADRFQTAREFRQALERYLSRSELRVSSGDVAQLVAEAFEDDRLHIRSIIEEQVANADRTDAPISLQLHPASLGQTGDALPRVSIHPTQLASETPPAAHLTQLSQEIDHARRSRSRLSVIVAGGVLAATVAIGTHLLTNRSASPEIAAPAVSSSAAATLTLTVRYPQGSRLKLDGGYVEGQPFSAVLPKDGTIHKLEVEQDGFTTETRTVTFDRDVDVSIELTPLAHASSLPAARPAGGGARPAAGKPSATGKPDEEEGARKRPSSPFNIDEDNPYRNKK
jgi:serine/threonine-protein kinase